MIRLVSTHHPSSCSLLTFVDARAVFETVVGKITSKPENVHRAKTLFLFFHDYESQFGELAQITKLEQRMLTLYPEDPQLQRFSQRFAGPTFDPTTVRPIVSPRTQMRPVMPSVMNSVEEHHPVMPPQMEQRFASPPVLHSPHLGNLLPTAHIHSPKRPLEDVEDNVQPRKMARGESPALKGAAGRRLDAARRNLATSNNASGNTPVVQGPTPLAREINFLLSIIPPSHTYRETRFKPEAMVDMLRNVARIPMPTLPGGVQPPAPQRYGTTPTTAQQLASIQEKYGNQSGHQHTLSAGSAWGA
jgi:cleavage stimulation factor subunit 3